MCSSTFFFRFNFAFGNFNFREKCDLHVCPLSICITFLFAMFGSLSIAVCSASSLNCRRICAFSIGATIRCGWSMRMRGYERNMCVMVNQTNDAMKCAQIYSCIYYGPTATIPTCLLSLGGKKI